MLAVIAAHPSACVMFVLALVIASFFVAFERSRPQAGELVVVSQLCALAICARAIFSFVPYFNPVIAIIMLSGIALGARKGFMVGALTAFGSNFIFGQGPWTLYQMASWGLAGVIFALLAHAGAVRRRDWTVRDYLVAAFCAALTIIFVTGPLADLSGVFMFGVNDWRSFWALLAGGFVLNVTLAASTVITFLLAGNMLLFALSRATRAC